MEDKELFWNRYSMHIDLYQKYMNIVLKVNIFYYGITGAILSFYFSKNTNGSTLEYALVLPIFFSAALIALFWFGQETYKISMKDIEFLVTKLNMNYYVRTDSLIFVLRGSILFLFFTTIGLAYLLISNSL